MLAFPHPFAVASESLGSKLFHTALTPGLLLQVFLCLCLGTKEERKNLSNIHETETCDGKFCPDEVLWNKHLDRQALLISRERCSLSTICDSLVRKDTPSLIDVEGLGRPKEFTGREADFQQWSKKTEASLLK